MSELVKLPVQRTGERMAELATILRLSGGLHTINGRIALEAELHTPQTVQRVRKDLAELYGVRAEARQLPPTSVRPGAPQFLVRVIDGETLARQLGLLDQRRRPIRGLPNRVTTGDAKELAAALRGAFLARGKITPPGRTVSLEVVCPSSETAMALVGAASRIGVDAKSRDIRGVSKLLVRDGEAIGLSSGSWAPKSAAPPGTTCGRRARRVRPRTVS